MKEYLGLQNLVSEILMSDWDPLGLQNEPFAHKEYDSIAHQVVGMLFNGKSEREIANFLERFVSDNLCLQPEDGVATRVAGEICRLKRVDQ